MRTWLLVLSHSELILCNKLRREVVKQWGPYPIIFLFLTTQQPPGVMSEMQTLLGLRRLDWLLLRLNTSEASVSRRLLPLPATEGRPRVSLPLSPALRVVSELGLEPAFIPAARLAEHEARNGNSWHSRSWSNTHCHRAGPAGSNYNWPAQAGRCTPSWGPLAGRPLLAGAPSPPCCC